MKAGTTESMKFMVLKSRLKLPKYVVVGLLESLWSLTARSAPRGDVGKFSNIEIAAWLEWDKDPDELIEAFIESKFLDFDDEHRLIVHDWHEHAPSYIKGNIQKSGGFIVKNSVPKDAPNDIPKDSPKDMPRDTPTKSSLVKSSQANKNNSRKALTFSTWMKLIPEGEDAIPEDHHVFRYAEKVGIPMDFLKLAWMWFEKHYSIDEKAKRKRYADWPAVFRKAVEGNWAKIWFIQPDGQYTLTTIGIQLTRDMEAA